MNSLAPPPRVRHSWQFSPSCCKRPRERRTGNRLFGWSVLKCSPTCGGKKGQVPRNVLTIPTRACGQVGAWRGKSVAHMSSVFLSLAHQSAVKKKTPSTFQECHWIVLGRFLFRSPRNGKRALRHGGSVHPILCQPQLLLGEVPGFSGESSLLEGPPPPCQ